MNVRLPVRRLKESRASTRYGVSLLERSLLMGLRSVLLSGVVAINLNQCPGMTAGRLRQTQNHGHSHTERPWIYDSVTSLRPLMINAVIEVNKQTRRDFLLQKGLFNINRGTMLLQKRAVFALGLRMCSTHVTKGHLMDTVRPNSDMSEFRKVFSKAKHIAIITGAGVSAESGVPTFRGENEKWRKWQSQDLATPEAFSRTPSRVWEFYHYRREMALSKKPSAAHLAIAECEARLRKQGRSVVVITQCIDDLHRQAGSKHVLKIHGSLAETRCVSCGHVTVNKRSPICAALKDKGSPDPDVADAQIPVDKLPRCGESDCHGLLRPNVVFFGETLDSHILTKVEKEMETCDLCLVVGTSSIVYPAAMFGPQIASRGIPVAEFNTKTTPKTEYFTYHFQGPCGTTLPPALARHESEVI